MENYNKESTSIDTVFLDNLTFSAFLKLFWGMDLKKITVLEKIRPRQKIWHWLLQRKGINVVEATFFSGHLKTDKGESILQAAHHMAGEVAMKAAGDIVSSEPQLKRLNEVYGRNTIRLFIAKQLTFYIAYWTVRALIAQSLSTQGRVQVWQREPTRIRSHYICEALGGIDVHFYPTKTTILSRHVMLWVGVIVRYVVHIARDLAVLFMQHEGNGPGKPSILMLKEDDLLKECSLRGQPHWVDLETPSNKYNMYVFDFYNPVSSLWKDPVKQKQQGLHVLNSVVLRKAERCERRNQHLSIVRGDRRKTYWAALKARRFISKYYLVKVALLLKQAELMGALALWLNAKVFLISENYYPLADAMLLIAPKLHLETISYQYSNLPDVSPIMLTTADKFLIFSEMYKTIFQNNGIEPVEFHVTGYLFNGIDKYVRHKSRIHREALERTGAKFIVCYFDENVQHNRWGLVSKKDHLGELHTLAEMVLSDPTFAVVVKSQFMVNSPSQLYPNDMLIKQAKETGRYVELKEGIHRNNIYPTEAALVSDLCIGHKFGATAALEAAIAGVRTILLDRYGTKTLWDSIYSQADIEYETIDSLIEAINRYRAGDTACQSLGDWSPIIHHFDPYCDGKTIERLRSIVTDSITTGEIIAQH